jgi:alginate O-acetyltransferase complex protein AlgI
MMDFFTRLLLYDSGSPLLFTQASFWLFLGIILFLFSLLYRRISIRNGLLLLASLFFYYKAGGINVLVLLFVILINYFLSLTSGKTAKNGSRLILLLASLFLNLGLLLYFKYTGFIFSLVRDLTGLQIKPGTILFQLNFFQEPALSMKEFIVPIGISFYSFQLISYAIEVFRKKIEPVKRIIDFGFYISFFPNLISGPIVKPQEFIPQIHEPYHLDREEFGKAMLLILSGLVKKIVIADYLSMNFIGRVFESPHLFSGFENLMAIYGYTLQIYFDFSGYTDTAIGVALLLGFRLPPNFDSPYKARNIQDFWRRWHMTLTRWFRDYLFLPLAYWLSGKMQRNRYLMIRTERWIYLTGILTTFLLCGLWHGAAMNFVIWGGIHGVALIIHKFVYPKSSVKKKENPFRVFISTFITFNFIVVTWVIFRVTSPESMRLMMKQIFINFHPELIPVMIQAYWKIFTILIAGFILVWAPDTLKSRIRNYFISGSDPFKVFVVLLIIIFVYQFKVATVQPFIYFQF